MTGAAQRGVYALLACFGAALACGRAASRGTGGWDGTVALLGDTTVITSRTPLIPQSIVHDSAEILWGQGSLTGPIGPVLTGAGQLVVGDITRLFVVTTDGHLIREIGRAGHGPGEFGEISDLGSTGDTIFVSDYSERRITLFDTAGTVLAIRPFPRVAELSNALPSRIATTGRGLLLGLRSIIFIASPRAVYGSVVLAPWTGDSGSELVRVIGRRYAMEGGDVFKKELFGPEPIIAISRSGRIASTDGMAYCIQVQSLDSTPRSRFCRSWTPVPVTSAVEHPDVAAYAHEAGVPAGWVAGMVSYLGKISVGPVRNSIDRMFWDEAGRLWVRVEDSLDANVNPMLEARTTSLRPAHWDVFAAGGKLLAEEYLPGRFTPYDGDRDFVYGRYELESGELAIARVAVSILADEAGKANEADSVMRRAAR